MANGAQKGKVSKDTEYIECSCHDMDHLSRLFFNEEDCEFSMEYRLLRSPGRAAVTRSGKFFGLRIWVNGIRRYFRGIRWAIMGRPQWFEGYAVWTREEAGQIVDFINSKIRTWDENKRALNQLIEALKYAHGREQEDGVQRPLDIPVRTDIGSFIFQVLPGTDLGELIRELGSSLNQIPREFFRASTAA